MKLDVGLKTGKAQSLRSTVKNDIVLLAAFHDTFDNYHTACDAGPICNMGTNLAIWGAQTHVQPGVLLNVL